MLYILVAKWVQSFHSECLSICLTFNDRCRYDLRYLRDLHNDFHGGLGVTYVDAVTGVEEVEQAGLAN